MELQTTIVWDEGTISDGGRVIAEVGDDGAIYPASGVTAEWSVDEIREAIGWAIAEAAPGSYIPVRIARAAGMEIRTYRLFDDGWMTDGVYGSFEEFTEGVRRGYVSDGIYLVTGGYDPHRHFFVITVIRHPLTIR